MDKKQIAEFLATNPSQEEMQRSWDQHLTDVGYVRGMPLMCGCGCYQFAWGEVPKDGLFYLPGHRPLVEPAKNVEIKEFQPRKVDRFWWARGMGWFLQASFFVVLFAVLFGVIVDFLVHGGV